jgi:adenylate cyclase class 2
MDPINLEIEAKFLGVDKDEIRRKLEMMGASILRPEFDQKRVNFYLPGDRKSPDSWLRIRDDGGEITLSLKEITGLGILDQKEISIKVDDFDNAERLLESMGCEKKKLIFTKRESWKLGDIEVTIEIEGPSEESVKNLAESLGFDFSEAVFGAVGKVYKDRFGISLDEIEEIVGNISFDNEKMRELLKGR